MLSGPLRNPHISSCVTVIYPSIWLNNSKSSSWRGGVIPWIEVYSSGSPEPDIWRNVIIPAGNFSSCASLEVDSRATVECTVLRHKSTLLGFNYLPLSSRAHYIRPLFERHLEVDHNRAKQSLTRSDRKLF